VELERETRILSKTYFDRMDIFRNTVEQDPDTGETRMKEKQIYHDRPCALCVSNKKASDEETIMGRVSNENVVFADPSIQMQNNDRIVVHTASGQTYEGRTGITYVVGSHGETAIKIERMA
jgi:hypothetical protein